jgi:hypothetical protein
VVGVAVLVDVAQRLLGAAGPDGEVAARVVITQTNLKQIENVKYAPPPMWGAAAPTPGTRC